MSKDVETIETEVKNNTSIYEKIQMVRDELSHMEIKKGGKNKFANYNYFELPDFLPQSNRLCSKHRITPIFNIDEDKAWLEIHDFDSDDTVIFHTPSADATTLNKQGNPSNLEIQSLGSQHTYLKRYLYMHFLELAENDGLEVNTGNDEYTPKKTTQKESTKKAEVIVPVKKATKEQITDVLELFEEERIEAMLKFYKVKGIKDIPKDQLDVVIKKQKAAKLNEQVNAAPSLDDVIK